MASRSLLLLLVCICSSPLQAQWTALNGPPGGNAYDIEFDAGKVYTLVNNEKMFVSSNEGASWTDVPSVANLYPYDMLVDNSKLYIVSYSSLYKSEDAAATWQRVNANGQFTGAQKLYRHTATNSFLITGWDGIFVSVNEGVNWTKIHEKYVTNAVITPSGDLYFSGEDGISKHPAPASPDDWAQENVSLVLAITGNTIKLAADNSGVYAVTDTDILKSSNNGSTWPSIKTATVTDTYFYPSVLVKAPNGIYVFNGSSSKGWFTGNGGSTWSAKTYPPASSTINDVKFLDNNKVLVASYMDGVIKSTDAAVNWSLSSTGINFPQGRFIVITNTGRVVLAAGYGTKSVWYSDNQGSAWTRKGLSQGFDKLRRLPNNTLLALGYNQLQYSTDNGTNWTIKNDGTYIQDVAFNTTFSTNYYGIGYTRLAKSSDGISWTDMTITGLPTNYTGTMVTQDDSGNIFAYLYNSNSSAYEIYVITGLTAAGTTGTASLLTLPLGPDDTNYGFNALTMFVSNGKFYAASYSYTYITSDLGNSWNTINFSKSSLFPLKKGSEYGICAGTNGSLYISQDDGKTWTSTNLPGSSSSSYIADVAEDAAGDYYAAGYQAPAMKYTNELLLPAASLPPYIDFAWQPTNGPYGGTISRVFTDNANNTFAIASGKVYRTTPTFATWSDKSSDNYFYDIEIDKASGKLYAVTYSELLTSANAGDTWTVINSESIFQRRFLRRCANGDIVFAGLNNTVYVSTNGGTSFGSPKYSSTTHLLRDIVVTPSNAIILYLRDNTTPFHHSAVISTDRGVTWNPMPLHVATSAFARLSADASGNIYSSLDPVSKSSDNGANWTSIKGDLPTSNVFSKVFVSPAGDLYVLAYDNAYSIFKSSNGGLNWSKTAEFPAPTGVNDVSWLGTLMIAATNIGIYTSEDGGTTLLPKSTGITFSFFTDLELGGPAKLLAATSGLNFLSTDGSEWASQNINSIRYFFRKPDGTLMGNNFNALYTSPDQGATWELVSNLPSSGISKMITPDGNAFYGISGNRIYVTTNFTDWTEIAPSSLPSNYSFQDLAVDANGFIYVIVYNNSASVYECYQIVFGAGSKLNRFTNPANLLFYDGKVVLYERTGAISSSSDGSTWTTQSAPAGDKLIIANNGYYFVPQYGGTLWLSRDRGASWQNVGLSTTNSNYSFNDIVVNDYNGFAYATINNSVVRKSANIVIPPEAVKPVVSTLSPANSATNVSAGTTLRITFDEACLAVNGKKFRIFDTDNEITPVEIIDVSAGSQDGKTFVFTPSEPLEYLNSYFIIVDNGSFTDIFGNPFAGITSETAWTFTVEVEPDNIKPTIGHTVAAFLKGSSNKLQITVTDEGGSNVNASSVKVYYRGIMSGDTPTEAALTAASGNTFEVTVPDTWLDELGLEYVFEARDNQGNVQVSPADALTNGNYHKAYISYPETVSPVLPASVLSFGGELGNYRIFSIPHKLGNASFSSVFNELSGLEVKKDFRILNFNTDTEKYTEYPSLSSITRGTGYWINIKSQTEIKVDGASTPENSKTQLFSLTLKPGWNQIGNPYPFTISWNAVKNAVANDNIGVLKSFNGSTFVDDDKLNPFEGGFVLLGGTSNVSIDVPFSAKTSAGRISEHTETFAGGWLLPITIGNSELHTTGGVGMHPEADVSFDRFDDAMPPKIFDMPEISFLHSEHFVRSFTRDVVPPSNKFQWNFEATAGVGSAVIHWDAATATSVGESLYLLNETTQELIDMTAAESCLIDAGSTTTFRIFYGYNRDEIKPSRIALGSPYPNPFTDRATISFTLPENGHGASDVSLDIFDVLGRKVASIARGKFNSGFYAGEWIPEKGSTGSAFYLVRLSVRNKNEDVVMTQKIFRKE